MTASMERVPASDTRHVRRDMELRFGIALMSAIILLCVLVPIVSPFSTSAFSYPFETPGWPHFFGTDDLGQDVFVRTFAAGRLDLLVAVGVVAVCNVTGSLVGTVAATSPRAIDGVVMRIVDAFLAFPYVIMVLLIVAIVGPASQVGGLPRGLSAVVVALVMLGWTTYARLAHTEALALQRRDFISAARTLGYSKPRIIGRHLLPQVMRTAVAYSVTDVILVMGALAGFAFLGVGVQPPTPEWGSMMYAGRGYLQTAGWMAAFPGLLLAVSGIALSLIADGLLKGRART